MKVAAVVTAIGLLMTGVASAQQTPHATVAPTNQPDGMPAKGSNSFTESQTRARLAERGYLNATDLKKDDDGIWRGTAQQNGQPVDVWLDYKGNVGETH